MYKLMCSLIVLMLVWWLIFVIITERWLGHVVWRWLLLGTYAFC